MSKLNLENFNKILIGSFKDQSLEKQIEFIELELNIISDIFIEKAMEVLDELEESGYDSEKFRQLKNIKTNSEFILEELRELNKKLSEEEGAAGND